MVFILPAYEIKQSRGYDRIPAIYCTKIAVEPVAISNVYFERFNPYERVRFPKI